MLTLHTKLLEVQHQLLLAMAERTNDMFEHCRLMLVLLSRFPHTIDIHGVSKKIPLSQLHINNHSINHRRKSLTHYSQQKSIATTRVQSIVSGSF